MALFQLGLYNKTSYRQGVLSLIASKTQILFFVFISNCGVNCDVLHFGKRVAIERELVNNSAQRLKISTV